MVGSRLAIANESHKFASALQWGDLLGVWWDIFNVLNPEMSCRDLLWAEKFMLGSREE